MTLAHARKVTGIPAKRIQNAFRVLGKPLEYPLEDVRRLGLSLLLADYFCMELRRAWEVAGDALRKPEEIVRYGAPGRPQIEIDVPRYLTDFGLKCALAAKFPPRMAGRPGRNRRAKISPREFGIDLDALQANLERTPEERLKRLDENWKFVQALRA